MFDKTRAIACLSLASLSIPATGCKPSELKSSARSQQQIEVRSFVRQIFIEGVPYSQASRYSSDDVPTLVAMLADSAESPYWSNVVVTLGMIGDEQAVEPLISFINSGGDGILSPGAYTARTSAIISLGYLVNATDNRQALQYLRSSLNPQRWDERQITWQSPFHEARDRNSELSRMAILGLAVSGVPEAGESLRQLRDSTTAPFFLQDQAGFVAEALVEHETIARDGLAAYYRARARR